MKRTQPRPSGRAARVFLLSLTCGLGVSLSAATQEPAAATATPIINVTGYAVDDVVSRARLAILPLGSIEYHGPSGPLGTDGLIASGLATQLADRLGAVLYPTLYYTHSPAHTAAFRGTLTLRPETIAALLTDILGSMVAQGFEKIFVLNAHDGNIGPARLAISQVTHENPEAAILMVNWWETLPGPLVDSLRLFNQPNGGHGHGGPLELSVAATLAPGTVVAGKGPDLPALEAVSDDFPYYLEKSHAEGWPGYSGKLSEISAEKGERLVEIAEDRLARLVEKWLADPAAPGSW